MSKKDQDSLSLIEQRKEDHLKICIEEDVNSISRNVWDHVDLYHCSMPDLDMNEISLKTTFLKKEYDSPFLISSMTGGSPKGEAINKTLAKLSQEANIPMGVGSQRSALENKDKQFFHLKKTAPNSTLFANIGLVQLNYGVGIDDLKFLIDQIEAEALIFHLNPLQEAIQLEGDRNFKGLFTKLHKVCQELSCPIILKETGCGIDAETASMAVEFGVSAIDIAGMGGSHWGFIEGLRHESRRNIGTMFRNWGIPSDIALMDLKNTLPADFPIIASGGIRHGLDAAKAISLGATLCGMAKSYLLAAEKSFEQLINFHSEQCEALKIAMFCSNKKTSDELRESLDELQDFEQDV